MNRKASNKFLDNVMKVIQRAFGDEPEQRDYVAHLLIVAARVLLLQNDGSVNEEDFAHAVKMACNTVPEGQEGGPPVSRAAHSTR